MTNWIPDVNKYNLSGPPKWWLSKLHDFDDSLVVVPSRQGCYYRLAQRRHLNLSAHIVNDILFNESDTKMLASYSLVPVTTILSTANWDNPFLFEELRRRAPWRLGGAEAVAKHLEAEDLKEELDKKEATDQHISYLSRDAWNLYLKKIGLRTRMYSPTIRKNDNTITPKAPSIIIPKG